MATIGAFTANADGSYSGAIRTLSLNVKTVQIRPVEKTNERGPDFRIFSGPTEFGAAWKKTSRDNNEYLSVKLDDPSFSEAMNAALVVIDGVHNLVWSRPTGDEEDQRLPRRHKAGRPFCRLRAKRRPPGRARRRRV